MSSKRLSNLYYVFPPVHNHCDVNERPGIALYWRLANFRITGVIAVASQARVGMKKRQRPALYYSGRGYFLSCLCVAVTLPLTLIGKELSLKHTYTNGQRLPNRSDIAVAAPGDKLI